MIILDTHAWIWWEDDPSKLSARARKRVESSGEMQTAKLVYIR